MSAEFAPLTKTQRLDRLDARLAVVEAALAGYGPPPPAKQQAPAESGTFDLLTVAPVVPPGVVSPHVRRNLDALAAWTEPSRWGVGASPAEAARLRAMLDHLHGLVMTAMLGEDVPLP